jgi:enediyne biosynthesis protein E4
MASGRGGKGRALALSLLAILGVGLWGGREWWVEWGYRRALKAIRAEIEGGHYALASHHLGPLLAWTSNRDRVLYLLGFCERSRGHRDAAAEAWGRIPPSSRFAVAALLGRIEMDVERGRLDDAERLAHQALADPRIDATEAVLRFAPVYRLEGRVADARELIEAAWEARDRAGAAADEPAILLVRLHVEITSGADPVETIRSILDQAGRLVPEDDRVWLGKANLATRVGAHDEARGWLDACLRRRPDDVSVWRARLDWAMASDRLEEALEAMRHLPDAAETPARIQRRTAWLAARRGDPQAERSALESLISDAPAEFDAHDRLIALAIGDHRPDLADRLRSRKSEIQGIEARYQTLYRRNLPTRDAEEMARLAEQLGRWFEARGFLTVALAADPGREDLRAALARVNQECARR